MSTNRSQLDSLRIAMPCSTDWDSMDGDERTRYCHECKKYVHDFAQMTENEAAALVSAMRGRLCARITRRDDGMILRRRPLARLPETPRRALPLAGVVVTTVISLTANAAAQPPTYGVAPPGVHFKEGKEPRASESPTLEPTSAVFGAVSDPFGAAIVNATITLQNQENGLRRGTVSPGAGEYRIDHLEPGEYSIQVEAEGFSSSNYSLTLLAGQEQRRDVTMEKEGGVVVTMGIAAERRRTLRTLYDESDLVVVARVGRSKEIKADGESHLMNTALDVSLVLKGQARRPIVYYDHWTYGGDPQETAPGDEVLFFLSRKKATPGIKFKGGYEAKDWQSVKKLPADELNAYIDRIMELSRISQGGTPSPEAITEWLVGCAEVPATRWEGGTELLSSYRTHRDRGTDKDRAASEGGESVPATSHDVHNAAGGAAASPTEPNFAALLTKKQKDGLIASLRKTDTLTERDEDLIWLLVEWRDLRLIPILISQLHRLADDPPPIAETFIEGLAELMDHESISDLADEYHESAEYDDLFQRNEVEPKQGEEAASDVEDDDDRRQKADAARKQRSAMLKTFLDAVESKLQSGALNVR